VTTETPTYPKLDKQRYPFQFNWFLFIKSNPLSPTAIFVSGVLSIGLVIYVSLFFTTPLIVTLLAATFYYHGVNRHHRKGYLMPAQVISLNPCQIAVYTDLATNKATTVFPALKVIRLNNPDNTLRLNDKTPVLAIFQGDESVLRWDDISPKLIRSSTTNEDIIQSAKEKIPQQAWQALERGIMSFDAAPTNGLHLLFEHDTNKEHEYYGVTNETDAK